MITKEQMDDLKRFKINADRCCYLFESNDLDYYNSVLGIELKLLQQYNELSTYQTLYDCYHPLLTDDEIKKLHTTLELMK